MFGVVIMLIAGIVGFCMERWGFPVAPTILGVVLGTMLEEHFFSSLIKADGNFLVSVLRAADRRHTGRSLPVDLAVAGGAHAAAALLGVI